MKKSIREELMETLEIYKAAVERAPEEIAQAEKRVAYLKENLRRNIENVKDIEQRLAKMGK